MTIRAKTGFPPGLKLWTENGNLNYRIEVGRLNKETLGALKNGKQKILDLLNSHHSDQIILFPLAENQKALWFLHELSPSSSAYNIALSFKIRNEFNSSNIKRAFDILIHRHWPLKSKFITLPDPEEQVYQCVFNSSKQFFEIIDCPDNTEYMKQTVIEKYKLPFNLAEDSLIKVYLFRSKRESVLLINVHHIICDGLSLKLLFEQFIELYHDFETGRKPDTTPAPNDYQVYIEKQTQFLLSNESLKQFDYWKNVLKSASPRIEMKTDFLRPPIPLFEGSTLFFRLKEEPYNKISNYVKNNNTTTYVFLFTVFELFLAKLSRQNNFCIGTPVAARTDQYFESNFGYFLNMLPIPADVAEAYIFHDQINKNKKKILDALDNQDYPFPLLVDKLAPNRDASRTPQFQIMFNLMNRKTLGPLIDLLKPTKDELELNFDSLTLSPFKINDQEGQFDLTLEVLDDSSALYCALKYNTSLFKKETVEKFQEEIIQLIDFVLQDDERVIPLTLNKVSPSFQEKQSEKPEIIINLTGTFTVENLISYFQFWLDQMEYPHQINDVVYNQIEQQLLNPKSEFYRYPNSYNLVFIRIDDWINKENKDHKKQIESAYQKYEQFAAALDSFTRTSSAHLLITLCPSSVKSLQDKSISQLINDLESKINKLALKYQSVYFIHYHEILNDYHVREYDEPLGENLGHLPFTEDFSIGLSTIVCRKIYTTLKPPFKAVVFDCDGTLWKGVLGEDGISGLSLGKAEIKLQQFALDLYNKGYVLCLCSKNEEEDIFEVFSSHPHMLLKNEHIAFRRINWKSKPENLISIAREMNVSLNSIVFVDDNPIECVKVRMVLPEVLAIQKKNNCNNIDYITNSFAFDILKLTEEDKLRSKHYLIDQHRQSFHEKSLSFADFIQGLKLQIDIQPINEETMSRVSQLSFRTNQFNFTTIRRTEREIKQLLKDRKNHIYTVKLKDRFGDYGLIAVMILQEYDNKSIRIDSFFVSCRALGKGVEHEMIQFIVRFAQQKHCSHLIFPFNKTKKNTPAKIFLTTYFNNHVCDTDKQTLIYCVPLEQAQKVVFKPDQISEPQKNDEPQKSDKPHESEISSQILERNAFISKVSQKYYSGELIRDAILKNTQQNRKPLSTGKTNSRTEKILLKYWQQVLNVEHLDVKENFFEIGGRSILIPQILIKLKKFENIDLHIVHMFQYPTIKSLAQFIEGSQQTQLLKTSQKLAKNQKTAIQQQKERIAMARLKNTRI